ncbi:MAG: RQC domain-containing protein [Verrucomicrobia bacterium]|nr:RQC domain-containing protein [Verrucomicrobiota bacterium]MDA1086509.1 RQC domain-containing protein [Verrucomicrobiota bacterium]
MKEPILRVLRDVFGFDSFLPNQEEIVQAIVERQDAFIVMPTGGGKSLCYQLPAHVMNGTCMVISPLISLMKDQVDVMVATIAFGMGIDKSNVRYVLHGDLPKNIEGYYQETGRSGRDGEPAHCLLLFGYGDIPKIRFFIDQTEDESERTHQVRCLNHMVTYATVHACRRKQLLGYFGEVYPDARDEGGNLKPEMENSTSSAFPRQTPPLPCCDICAGEVESIDATQDAQIVMSAIARTDQRFGVHHIVAVVTGERSDRIRQLEHDQIKTFGVGRDRDKRHWRLIIDNLLAQGLIEQTTGDYPVLKLQPESKEVLFGGRQLHVLKTRKQEGKRPKPSTAAGPYDQALFETLRTLRKRLAVEQGVPPFVVFSDKTLHQMCQVFPTTTIDMTGISGVGQAKLARYGETFCAAIREHLKNQPGSEKRTVDA